MKIAWFTPFSRMSAIGQLSSIVVQTLAKYAEITVYVSDTENARDTWLPEFNQRSIRNIRRRALQSILRNYDMLIYNMGDYHPWHSDIFEILRAHPGIVILHDLVLQHFFAGYFFEMKRDQAAYVEALAFSHGEKGRELGTRVIQGQTGNIWEDKIMLQYHMAKVALHGSYGVVVHSRFARAAVEAFAAYPVAHIDFPGLDIQKPPLAERTGSRPVRLLSYGMLNRNKMIHAVIDAIGQSTILTERVVFDVIGKSTEIYLDELNKQIARYNLSSVVNLLGYQPDDVLHRYIADADIIVNLRNPHFGESSWVLLESAFSAKPTVVWKHGYYDEFPDHTVAKVTDDSLRPTLEALVSDESRRSALGREIFRYAQNTFNTERYCQELLRLIEQARYNKPLFHLIDFMSAKIAEIQPGDSTLARRAAAEIARLT